MTWVWYAHNWIGVEVRGLRAMPLDPFPTTRVLDTPLNPWFIVLSHFKVIIGSKSRLVS